MQSALIQRAFPVCYRSQVRKTKGSAAFCDQRMTFDIRSWTAEHSVNSLATVQFQTNCEASKRASLRHGKLHVNSDKCLILIGEKKRSIKMTDKAVTSNSYSSDDYPNKINKTSVLELDDWDALLWNPEQRRLLGKGQTGSGQVKFISLGVLLSLVVLFGIIANSAVLFIISRYFQLNLYFIIGNYRILFF